MGFEFPTVGIHGTGKNIHAALQEELAVIIDVRAFGCNSLADEAGSKSHWEGGCTVQLISAAFELCVNGKFMLWKMWCCTLQSMGCTNHKFPYSQH